MKNKIMLLAIVLVGIVALYGCTDDTSTPATQETTPTSEEVMTPVAPPPETQETQVETPAEVPAQTTEPSQTNEAPAPTAEQPGIAEGPVTIHWEQEVDYTDHHEFVADRSEPQVKIVITTDTPVRDFEILELELDDDTTSEEIRFDTDDIFELDVFTPEKPIVMTLTFMGTIPNYGLSYEDENGRDRYFSISESGRDGSLVLAEFRED